jgi:1-acyl-sn-glycerol-3-phosphate acyltransferase
LWTKAGEIEIMRCFWPIAILGFIKYLPPRMEAATEQSSRADSPRREFARREEDVVCGVLRAMNVCFSRIYHHLTVATPCTLPRRGPAILVCNHISALDPVLIQAASPRLIRWMMAGEYYSQPSLRWLLDLVGTIPVERTGRDLAATRAALRALEMGYVLGVFPEGKIETSQELLPFQNGLVLLGAKSQAPICPAYIDGSQRYLDMLPAYLRPQRSTLTFGQPIKLNREDASRQRIDEAGSKLQSAVEILRLQYLTNTAKASFPRPPPSPIPHTFP